MITKDNCINVLIVGRVNVGKSTLFNALVKRNLSITDKLAGTTRDFVTGELKYKNLRFNFIDTAGFGFFKDDFYKVINTDIQDLLKLVDIVFFVLDAKSFPVDEDYYIYNHLAKTVYKKTILVFNKVDNENLLSNLDNFKKFKFDYSFTVSAAHKKGIVEIMDFIAGKSQLVSNITTPEEKTATFPIKVAIIGKRSVGKSSFINAIFNKRVRLVSPKSPTTRDIGEFTHQIFNTRFTIFDTAGLFKIRKNVKSPEIKALSKVYDLLKQIDVVLLFFDITDYMTQFDKLLCHTVIENKKPFILCFNKIDLLDDKALKYEKFVILREFSFIRYAPIVFLSAKNSTNVHKPFRLAIDLYSQSKARVQTSHLNLIIKKITSIKTFKRYRKLGKIYYATQISSLPPTLALFVNDKTLFSPSNLKFLENSIRKKTNFTNVPLVLKLINRK